MPQVTVEDVDNPNKDEAVKPVVKQEKQEEAQYASLDELQKIQKQLNGLSYIGRKFDEMARKIDSLSANPNPGPVVNPADQDEYDKLVEKDWKAAVRKLAQEEAASLRQKEREEEARRQMEAKQLTALEQSKKTVLDRYPDLKDETSEVAQKFKEVVAKHPEYISNEYGPILAMREMEEELRSEGKLDNFSKKVVDKEVERRARTGATSIPKGAAPSSGKTTLTPEERRFCEFNGIKYETYLKNKHSLSSEKQTEA